MHHGALTDQVEYKGCIQHLKEGCVGEEGVVGNVLVVLCGVRLKVGTFRDKTSDSQLLPLVIDAPLRRSWHHKPTSALNLDRYQLRRISAWTL